MEGFKEFLLKTNALALAVGVIIGGAAGKVVSSLVSDVMMPPLGLLLGKVDFSNLYINLGAGAYATLDEARRAGAPVLALGAFANTILDFIIVAFCIYMISKYALRPAPEPPAPPTKTCGECAESVAAAAKKCRYCASAV
jgi:large conductance mechanosensitive channel